MGLLWITRDILCGNGSFFSIFSILGGCASQSSTNNKQPARELLPVSSVITSQKRIISPRDDIFGDIHHSERSSANREKSGGVWWLDMGGFVRRNIKSPSCTQAGTSAELSLMRDL